MFTEVIPSCTSQETKSCVNCKHSDRMSKSVSNEAENLETPQRGRSKEPHPGTATTDTILQKGGNYGSL